MFERLSRGAILTPAGRAYLKTAERVVREFADLNNWLHDTRKGRSGRLAVGFYTSLSAGNLRAIWKASPTPTKPSRSNGSSVTANSCWAGWKAGS